MSDEAKQGQAQPSTGAQAAIDYSIVHNKQPVDLRDIDTMKKYAQIGYNDEHRREQLKRQREEYNDLLAREREKLSRWDEFSQFLQRNPTAAQAIERIYAGQVDPNQVVNPKAGTGDEDGDATQAPTGSDHLVLQELRALKDKLSTIEARDQQRDKLTAQQLRDQAVDAAIKADHVLAARPALHDMAKREIVSQMEANGMDVDAAVLLASNQIQQGLSDAATTQRDQLAEQQNLRTLSPRVGTPPTREDMPELDPKDSTKQRMAKTKVAAKAWLQNALAQARSGPGI